MRERLIWPGRHLSASFVAYSPVALFFLLSFALAWSWWLLVGWLFARATTALILPGAWAPTIAAFLLTARSEGRRGVRMWLAQLTRWRVHFGWYLVAILGPTLVALIAVVINGMLGGTGPSLAAVTGRFGLQPAQLPVFIALLPLVFLLTIVAGGPIAEELGWRGYAQPRLQARVGVGRAGALIGLAWSLWHLPLFIVLPSATGDVPAAWFVPLVTTWGVLFAWFYNRTGGSVLLSMLLHAGINFPLGALGLVTTPATPQLLSIFTLLMLVLAIAAWYDVRHDRSATPQRGNTERV